LLDQALELEGDERRAFLDSVQGDDAALGRDLGGLLAKHDEIAPRTMPDAMQLVAPAVARSLQDDAALDESRLGHVVGSYRLVRLLGAGGMGVVYLAERCTQGFSQQVALKLVRRTLAGAGARERFERERQILAGLRHPGIASLFDGGQTEEGHAFYTMEYVEGLAVTDYCEKEECSVAMRIGLLIQVATALGYAHQHLTVHRDIKPSNVLVTAECRVKLVDFGLAKLLDNAATPQVTQMGLGPMTPGYAAPEQFRNGAITVATDIYQFGVLCFVLLTGRLPYRGDPGDSLEWARAVTEQEPMRLARAAALDDSTAGGTRTSRPAKLRRQLTRDLDAIVRKALAKTPSQRYRSMDELISDLEAFLHKRPVTARRAGPLYFVWRFVQRWRYAVAATVMAFVALAITAVIAARQSVIAETEAAHANAVAGFLVSLFQVSDPGVNRGEKLTANQILERGAERLDHEMASQPEQRARMLATIGEVYESMGDFQRAEKPLAAAVAISRGAPSHDSLTLGHDLHRLAWATFRQGNTATTLELLDESEASIEQSRSPRALEELIVIRTMRALAHADQGDYPQAELEFRKLFETSMSEELRTSEAMASAHNNFASILNYEEKLQEALREHELARELFRRKLGEDHYKTMSATSNLANTLVVLHDYDGALAILEPLAQRQRRILGESNASYAIVLNLLGLVADRRGEYETALQYYASARTIFQQALGERHRNVAYPIAYSGDLELERGNLEAALQLQDAALQIRREALPADHPDIAFSYYARSRVLLALGRALEAKWDAEEALTIRRSRYPEGSFLIADSLADAGLARHALDDFSGAQDALAEAMALERRFPPADMARPAKLTALIDDPDGAMADVARILPAEP
jgi:serine/threonine-protein kinase